jgi:DivIVA domain-containing protein
MIWLLAIVAILVIGALVVLAVARGTAMAPAFDDRREVRLPADRPLRADDVRSVRFTMTLRGYRMAEVDALLARLAAEMDERATAATHDPDDVTAPMSPPGEPHAR